MPSMTAGGPENHIIDGRFELRARLGGGGMGLVWRAYDLALHREVALKEVRASGSDLVPVDPQEAWQQRERVLREARALARLQHPNVVTIHHIVDSPQVRHPWLVMELVAGGSLADRLERGPLEPGEAARLGRGVLAALTAAHVAGIQHRDVKPANVLLRPDGTPVLTDFGIAALQDSTALTAPGTLIGSPEYIAPERIRGREGDPASDLWSLGMLLYTAVEGDNPMRRATTLATLAAVLDEPVPPPRRAAALTPVLAALLQRDPAARPPEDALDRMFAEAQWAADGTRLIPGPAWAPFAGAVSNTQVTDVVLGEPRDMPPGAASARKRRSIFVAVVSAVAVVALAAAVLVTTELGSRGSGNGTSSGNSNADGNGHTAAGHAPTTGSSRASGEPASSPSQSAGTNAAAGGDVTSTGDPTLAWMNTCISALEKAMGTTKVLQLVIYSDHAMAEAPIATDPTEYNEYDYIDGSVSSSPGGTVDDGSTTVDIGSVNWDAVPGLFAQADSVLKVPSPNLHYVVLDTELISNNPELLVYLANDYGGGYIDADLNGSVIQVYSMSS
jgi:serine/threonine protein kinase